MKLERKKAKPIDLRAGSTAIPVVDRSKIDLLEKLDMNAAHYGDADAAEAAETIRTQHATIARLQREAEGLTRERNEARRVQSTRDKLAFPLPSDGHTHGSEPGMTLREYFAAKAFPALIQSLAMRYTETGYSDESAVNHAARYAAHAADALIEHLSHPDSETQR